MKKGAIISGATGMVGIALTKYLLKNDYFVLLLIRKKSIKPKSIDVNNKNLMIVDCSLSDYATLQIHENFNVKFESFYHLAWAGTFGPNRDDANLQVKNVEYTLDAIRLAKQFGCKSFVGLGSQAEYGIRQDYISEEDKVNPSTCYGISKYTAGKLGAFEAKKNKIKFNWCRLFSAYGPYGLSQSVLNYVVSSLKNGISPKLGPCQQAWNYIHVDDVACCLFLVAQKGKDGDVYNIASDDQRTLKDYIETIHSQYHSEIEINYSNSCTVSFNLLVKTDKLKNELGFKPKHSFDKEILTCYDL